MAKDVLATTSTQGFQCGVEWACLLSEFISPRRSRGMNNEATAADPNSGSSAALTKPWHGPWEILEVLHFTSLDMIAPK